MVNPGVPLWKKALLLPVALLHLVYCMLYSACFSLCGKTPDSNYGVRARFTRLWICKLLEVAKCAPTIAWWHFEVAGFFNWLQAALLHCSMKVERFKVGDGTRCELISEQGTISSLADAEVVVLYAHGGAFIGGSPPFFYLFLHDAVRDLPVKAAVLLVDYTLAPAATTQNGIIQKEMLAAYQHIKDVAPRAKVVLMGDSAGATLAFAFCLRQVRQRGAAQPDGQVLLSAWVPADAENLNQDNVAKDMLHAALLESGNAVFSPGEPEHEDVAPDLGKLHGLPETLLVSGTNDLMITKQRELFHALQKCGVPTTVREVPSCMHNFMLLTGSLFGIWILGTVQGRADAVSEVRTFLTKIGARRSDVPEGFRASDEESLVSF